MSAPSNPGWVEGQVPSAAEWNAEWSAKADYPVPVDQGGTGATTATGASSALLQRSLVAATPITLAILNTYGVRTSLSPFLLNLPALNTCTPGDYLFLYDAEYNANVNNVTLVPNGTDRINLYASNLGSVVFNVADFWAMVTVGVSAWRVIVRTS